tara:strand:- start:4685 stop:10234 length:5550 start_codon:yes stop_codon:yes gene_type:complete
MADSKITQLSLSPYALDKDLIVVVTGHLEEGAFPRNVKMPLSYIRRYVVRLNLLTNPQSGISTFYNSGLNILTINHTPLTGNLMRYDYADAHPHDQTISTTGLNSIQGNNIEIQFSKNSLAATGMHEREGPWYNDFNKEAHLEEPYYSGIISVTGVNAITENNIIKEYEGAWPYSGHYYNSGLNTIAGNSIDIAFLKIDEAALAMDSRDGGWDSNFVQNNLQGRYYSGIISLTGLNAYSGAPYGNLMRVDIDVDQWPYSGVLSTTGLNSIQGNLVDIQFESSSEAAAWMHSKDGGWLDGFSKTNHLGNKYHSGIISITGLNVYSGAPYGNLMRVDFDVDQWPYSGVLSTTGLNAIVGNNMDIVFKANSEAAVGMHDRDGGWHDDFNKTNNLGDRYHSGIISTTGLNVYSGAPYGNLMRVDFDVDEWPYSGVLSTTGLNSIMGNNIDIQFNANSEAAQWMHSKDGGWHDGFSKSNNLGDRYHSGIVSVTGLNAYSGAPYGNLMRVDFDVDQWPYSGVISQTGLNSIVGNNMDIVFQASSEAAVGMDDRKGAWHHNFNKANNLGDRYHSGIVSTTGLNVYGGHPYGNLMRVDFDVDQWPYSGVLSQTGLNSIMGNNIDIQFKSSSEAAQWMHSKDGAWLDGFSKSNHLGERYHSGIISITGLNAYSGAPYGNLIRVDFDVDQWPYSGVISQTGLNVVRGNLIDVQFNADSEAATAMHARNAGWLRTFNKNNHLGNKYHSGIISITGVNAVTENLIVKEYQDVWPYTGIYYNTGLNATAGNHVEIQFSTNTDADFNYKNPNGTSRMGGRYHSGIISVTGLNVVQTTGNLIENYVQHEIWPRRNVLHTVKLNAYHGHPWGNNVRVDLDSQWPYSGIISQTGLNVIRGNLIDIQFDASSDAATKMNNSNGAWPSNFSKSNHLGNPYNSGIISVTGLNVGDAGNRIDYTIENDWPYKYNIDATGLNIVAGNTFANALNGIAYNIEPDGYKRYDLFSLDKIKHNTNTETLIHNVGTGTNSLTTQHYLDSSAFISYCNAKHCRPYDNLTLLTELQLRLSDNCIGVTVPPTVGLTSTSTLKEDELAEITTTAVTLGGITDSINSDYDLWEPDRITIEADGYPIEFSVTVSGNSVSLLDDDPITFITYKQKTSSNTNNVYGNSAVVYGTGDFVFEKYRTSTYNNQLRYDNPHLKTDNSQLDTGNTSPIMLTYDPSSNPYTLGAQKAMSLQAIVTPSISSSTYNINGCIGIKYSIKQTKYTRRYRKNLGQATSEDDGHSIGETVYRYITSPLRSAQVAVTVNNPRYIKCENMEQAPTISFTIQPTNQTADNGAATFTAAAKANDYTDLLYQWQEAPAGTTDFVDLSGKNTATLNLTSMQYPADNGKRYRLKVIAYDGITTATSNYATLTTEPPTLTVYNQPDAAPLASDGTAQFCAYASANISGTTIDIQWQVSTNGGASYSDITDETSNCLNLTGLSCPSDDGNLYRAKFSSSGFGTVYSNAAQLHCITITITGHPSDQTIARGIASWSGSATQTAGSPFTLYYIWEISTNGGASYSQVRAGTSLTTITNDPSTYGSSRYYRTLDYAGEDQSLWRLKVRLQGFGNDVEAISNSATLTIQEIDITSQPTGSQINGKTMITRNYSRNYIPTNNGSVTLSVTAVARNSSATLYYQWQESSNNGNTWTDMAGKTSATLSLAGLTQNTTENEYRCLVDDEALSGSDSTGMIRQESDQARVTTSTFISASNTNIDDNTSFATVDRDSTGTVSETMFITFCYDLTDEIGHTVSLDAQANGTATIEFGQPPALTSVASFSATHPTQVTDNKTVGASNSTAYSAGDVINLKVTGQVSQYLARLNIPLP